MISMNRHRIIDMVILLLPMLTKPLSLVDEMIKMVHATFSSVLMEVKNYKHLFICVPAYCIIVNLLENIKDIAYIMKHTCHHYRHHYYKIVVC